MITQYIDHSAKWNNQRNTSRSSNRYWQEFQRKENITLLANAGIQVVIASAGKHEKLGTPEFIVKKVKFFLASPLQTWAFHASFDFYHKSNMLWILPRSTSIHQSKISTHSEGLSKPMIHRLIPSIRIPTISKYTMNQSQS